MTGIIIALPKAEDGRKLKNILVRSGHTVTAVCTTGAQAVGHAEGLDDGIVICACRLPDMMFTELQMQLPAALGWACRSSNILRNTITPISVCTAGSGRELIFRLSFPT